MSTPILYDTHMHTTLCRHSHGECEEYAAVAQLRGLKGIIVTCHNPLPGGYSQGARMYPEQFAEYLALVDRARQAFAGKLDVRLGLECDVPAGMEDFVRRQIESAPFEYILGSVHPNIGEYRKAFWHGDALEFQRSYFGEIARVAETRLVDCLSHPDVVKHEHAAEWDVQRVMPDICRALDRIAATGCAMELNTSGIHKQCAQMSPAPEMLEQMYQRGIPVVIGSDAHEPGRVGEGFEAAMDLLSSAGYRQLSVFRQRRRQGDID